MFRIARTSSQGCDWLFQKETVSRTEWGRCFLWGSCLAPLMEQCACCLGGKQSGKEVPGADVDVHGLWATQPLGSRNSLK